ncbi:hypothetical protein PFISCL1PPCAC_27358, partial [Pristionchus fissidentatus]
SLPLCYPSLLSTLSTLSLFDRWSYLRHMFPSSSTARSHSVPNIEEEDPKLSVTSIPDIFNTASLLERKIYQTEPRFQFLIEAAKNGTERCQILAVKFMLAFYDLFPSKQLDAAKVALTLMNVNEENLRLTLIKDLHVIGNLPGFTKPVIEVLLQCTMSHMEEEKMLAYDSLVQFLHGHWLEVAACVRELLNKEHNNTKNRKLVLEFLNDRMRIIPLSMYKSKEVTDILEIIFKEEFARANLTYVDSLFMYLGNSFLMDNFEKQQSIAAHFIDSLVLPSYVPLYVDEPTTTTAKTPSLNAELDALLVNLTIVHQMTTVLHAKLESVNQWFGFFIANIDDIFQLPFERQCRALRAFAQFSVACSTTLPDEHVDALFDIVQALVPSFEMGDEDSTNLPKIDLHKLEPCCIALYNLRHLPYVGEKMENINDEFRKRMRFLVRYCQLKSTEYKRTVEELGEIPMRKEMNALVAAATSVGLFAIEILKPADTWDMKPRASWKSCWITRVTPRNPKKMKYPVKLPV